MAGGAEDAASPVRTAVRQVATRMLAELPTAAEAMQQLLVAQIPEAGEDDEIAGLTLGSCSSNLEAVLSMLRHDIDVTAAEAPVTAMEHARAMAVRGHSVAVMLRFYRLGHAWFIDRLLAGSGVWLDGRRDALSVVAEIEQFSFGYIDRISSQVAVEYVAELERLQRRTQAVRVDVVRALVAGEAVDPARAARQLSHALLDRQVGFVCWSDDAAVDLHAVGALVAGELGTEPPLLIADGTRTVWGWVTGAAAGGTAGLRARLPPAAHVASGLPGVGVAGFRRSHQEALSVRRIVELAGWRPPTVTGFGEVALIDALSRDPDAARSLVVQQLGELAGSGDRARVDREALLAVLDADGSLVAAARRLGLHRNTVLGRVRRAEGRRGRPSSIERLELHCALRLVEVLGETVLPGP